MDLDLDRVNLTDSCMSLNLLISKLGTSKRVKAAKLEVGELAAEILHGGTVLTDANDPKAIRASKRILECPTMKEIRALDTTIRSTVRTRSIQHLLRHGMHFVPMTAVAEIDEFLVNAATQRAALVDRLLTQEYQAGIDADEERLGAHFCRGDYLSVEQAREKFQLSHEWLAFETPQKLRSISPQLFQREQEKAKQHIHDAAAEVVTSMRQGLQTMIAAFVEKLKEPEPGKRKKQIREDSLDRLRTFIGNLKELNVSGDGELDELAERARSIVDGVDVSELKESEEIRDAVRGEFESLLPEAERLVEDAPRRRIVLTQAESAQVEIEAQEVTHAEAGQQPDAGVSEV